MLFISKMIYDPTWAEGRRFKRGNRLGLTVGLTFHTPKFWNCKETDFDMGGLWLSPPLPESTKALRHSMALSHATCRWPHRHMSYRGYLYWTGPRRRYELRYMGATHQRYRWWKPLSVSTHGRYVRWLDNGPRWVDPAYTPQPDDQEFRQALRDRHRAEAAQIRAEMDEWRRTH